MTTTEHGGVRLSHDDNGHDATPAFVFVHGWTCDRTFFQPQYDYFGRTARAVAVDLRGHGKSPEAPDGDYSVEAFSGDVAALIESLSVGPVVLVGHSLGGVISLATAARFPDLVAAVVMVDPAPFVISPERRAAYDGFLAAINGPDGITARAATVEGMFMATDDPTRKASIAATMAATPHAVAAPAITKLFDFDGAGALAKVQCPIASIGSDGPMNDPAALKAANPTVLIGQTLGAGHFNQLEVPDQVIAMTEQFLRVNL